MHLWSTETPCATSTKLRTVPPGPVFHSVPLPCPSTSRTAHVSESRSREAPDVRQMPSPDLPGLP